MSQSTYSLCCSFEVGQLIGTGNGKFSPDQQTLLILGKNMYKLSYAVGTVEILLRGRFKLLLVIHAVEQSDELVIQLLWQSLAP